TAALHFPLLTASGRTINDVLARHRSRRWSVLIPVAIPVAIPLAIPIVEPDVPKLDFAATRNRKRQRVGHVDDARLGVQQTEDPLRRGDRALKQVVLLREVLNGAEEPAPILEERGDDSDGHRAVEGIHASVPEDERESDRGQYLHDR